MKKFFNFLFILFFITFSMPINALASDFSNTDLANIQVELDKDGNPVLDQYKDKHKNQQESYNHFYTRYKNLIVGFSGLGFLTFIVILMYLIYNIAKTSENPTERTRYINGLKWTMIAIGGYSSITVFIGLAFKLFQ